MTGNQATNQITNQSKYTDIQKSNQTETEPTIIKPNSSILLDSSCSDNRRQGRKVQLKFSSSLQILGIDSKRKYIPRVLCAVGITIAQILIGATLMTIFLYSLRTGDAHAIICIVGYHFFSAEAILAFNNSNSWSKPLRLRHKRCMHILMQLCAIVCSTIGTLLFVSSEHNMHINYHGITGYITTALAVITLVLGPLAIIGSYRQTLIHIVSGLMTFTMSSISLCLGIFTPTFKSYVDSSIILYVILSFIIFYTLLIIMMCINKHVNWC